MNKPKNLEELLSTLKLGDKQIKDLETVLEKKSQAIGNILDFFMESGDPLSALSNGTVALSNVAMLISDINPVGNDKVFKTCDVLKDYLDSKNYTNMESLAILLISASLIVGTIDIESVVFDTPKAIKNEKEKAKSDAKKEAESMIDGLFDGELSEVELAKRIASIIKKSKQ